MKWLMPSFITWKPRKITSSPKTVKNELTRRGWSTCGEFHADVPVSIRHIQGVAAIPKGFGKVAQADFRAGEVVFTDERGASATAAVGWEFLA
jgi:hypothetical protein